MERQVKFNVRMDEALCQRLKAEAKRSVRSINGEIIHRLLESLKDVAQRASFGRPVSGRNTTLRLK